MIVMVIASRVKVLPLVTACVADNGPVAYRVSVPLVSAHHPAVWVAVTLPAVIAGIVTPRPLGTPAAGAPVFTVSLPQLLVLVASA